MDDDGFRAFLRWRMIRLAVATLCLGVLPALVLPARADTPDPSQARVLEQQIHDWIATAAGPKVTLPARPVQLTPADDHYRIDVPLGPLLEGMGQKVSGIGSLSGSLRALDGGRWAIDNLAPPSPSRFSLDPGPGDKHPPTVVEMNFRDQTSHSVIDPSFATPSTFASTAGAADIHISRGTEDQVHHTESATARAALTPATDGKVDLTEEAELRGFTTRGTLEDGKRVRLAIARLGLALRFDRLDRAQLSDAFGIMAAARQQQSVAAIADPSAMTPVQKALLHSLIASLRGVATGGMLTEIMEGVEGEADGHRFTARRFELSLGADAPTGMLATRIRLLVDGPGSADIPPFALPYVPAHIALQPYISGISTGDLMQMALAATEPGPTALPDPAVLFSHGGIIAGVDDLAVTVGETTVTGSGRVQALSPGELSGHATLIATHFDSLMRLVQQDPVLGPQALPVLLLAKGLAKPNGDQLVWDVTYENNGVTINGTDLSSIMGK